MTNRIEFSEGGKGDVIQQAQQVDEVGLITCPKCKGKGAVLKDALQKDALPKIFPSREIKYTTEKKTYKSLAMKDYSLPILPCRTTTPKELKKTWSTCNTLAAIAQTRSISNVSTESTSALTSLLPPEVTINNIYDHIKLTKLQFRSECPNDNVSALKGLVHLFRQDINSVNGVIREAYQRIADVLKASTTTELTRLACQVIKLISESITYISRPTFDDIVTSLLNKTADSKANVRTDAMEAITAIVLHYPHMVVIRALTKKAPTHKHHLVRSSVIQSLKTMTEIFGPKTILSNNAAKDARKKYLETLCSFLTDQHSEVRQRARDLTGILVGHNEFFEALEADIQMHVLKQIEGVVIAIKSGAELQ